MNWKKLDVVEVAAFAIMAVAIVVLGSLLGGALKWNDFYFRRMTAAEQELGQTRVVYFSDDRLGAGP